MEQASVSYGVKVLLADLQISTCDCIHISLLVEEPVVM